MIARLNDVAFKAVNSTGLQKMLDKRAVGNEELYQKLEKEAIDITKKFDFKKLAETHKEVIEDIGNCPLSCMDAMEALEEQDCMCIGLSVQRPEAAIADASRLVIKDIIPTYMTAESFLQSAQFKIQSAGGDGSNAHGGFGKNQDGEKPQLAQGLGNEDITGILPLFLFNEHWMIAKRKIQPIFGFMCTLDIMGYTSEQFFTIPFTVYLKAVAKHAAKPDVSINKKILSQVSETCMKILETSKVFREDVVQKVINFAYQKDKESTRTSDIIKTPIVLAAQFSLFLQIPDFAKLIENEDNKAYFTDEAKLAELKKKFTVACTEEVLRRQENEELADLITKKNSFENFLFAENEEFISRVYGRREAEIVKLHTVDKSEVKDSFSPFANEAKQLAVKLGYEDDFGTEGFVSENVEISEEMKVDPVNFEEEVNKATEKLVWYNSFKAVEFIAKLEKTFKGHNRTMMNIFGDILGDRPNDVYECLGLEGDKLTQILAILIQNGIHKKNSARVEACEKGSYITLTNEESAKGYVHQTLRDLLLNRLRAQTKALEKKFLDVAGEQLGQKLLMAPNVFYTAVMMEKNQMFFGKGDFQKVINALKKNQSPEFKDIGRKLALLKQGFLLNAKAQKGVNCETFDGITQFKGISEPTKDVEKEKTSGGGLNELIQGLAQSNEETAPKIAEAAIENMSMDYRFKIYADKSRNFIKQPVNYKHVFQIWANHVFESQTKDLTLTQLKNVFPEFISHLDLYDNCCNKQGQIVKNKEFYHKYKTTPHKAGKRSKTQKQKILAK